MAYECVSKSELAGSLTGKRIAVYYEAWKEEQEWKKRKRLRSSEDILM